MKPVRLLPTSARPASFSPGHHLVRWGLGTTVAAVVTALSFGLLGGRAAIAAKSPYTPVFTAPVEPYPTWTSELGCHDGVRPGVTATIEQILRPTYGGADWRFLTQRACSPSIQQGHDDGTSLDWMNRYDKAEEKANVEAFLGWLMATDSQGNTRALARRLGVMYLIWNNQFFGMYDAEEGWTPYNLQVSGVRTPCAQLPAAAYDTSCHRDHLHISYTPAGAAMETSYWKQGDVNKPTSSPLPTTPSAPPTSTPSTPSLPTTPSAPPTSTTPRTSPTSGGPVIVTTELAARRGNTVTVQGIATKPKAPVQIYVRRAGGGVWIPILMPFTADASAQFTLVYVTYITHDIKVTEGTQSSNIARVSVT